MEILYILALIVAYILTTITVIVSVGTVWFLSKSENKDKVDFFWIAVFGMLLLAITGIFVLGILGGVPVNYLFLIIGTYAFIGILLFGTYCVIEWFVKRIWKLIR